MNSLISRSGQLAMTVMLMVLPGAAVTAQTKSIEVQGLFDGHGIGAIQFPTLQATASGGGSATGIGRFTYSLNATVNLPTNTSTGLFLLVFSNGDVIHGTFTGAEGQAGPGSIVEDLVINGGTGRFQGATGAFKLNRIVDMSTLPAYETHGGTLAGTITTLK